MFSPKSLVLCGLAAFMSLPATSMARITGMTAPATAKIGAVVTTTFEVGGSSSNWVDYGVVVGIEKPMTACAECIGQELKWTNIQGTSIVGESGTTFPIEVTIPSTLAAGDYELKAGVPYLAGVSGGVGFKFYTAKITIS